MKIWAVVLVAFASAVCTLLSSAPFGLGIAAIGAPYFLILLVLFAPSTRLAVKIVFIFQIPLWLWLHIWVEGVTVAGWIALSVYMSIWAPLFVLILRRTLTCSGVTLVVQAPLVWVGLECLRGIVLFDGYPWYLTGTGILDWPIVSIASVGSVWAASFLVVVLAASFAIYKQVKWWTWSCIGVVCAIFLFLGIDSEKHFGPRMDVAVIQTNVPQSNKVAWSWEEQLEDVSEAIRMTLEATLTGTLNPSLIIWPETMLPGSGFDVHKEDYAPWEELFTPHWIWPQKIIEVASEIETPILVGSQTLPEIEIVEGNQSLHIESSIRFNSSVLVRPDGETERYDKVFLTPFGETIPYLDKVPFLRNWFRDNFGAEMLFNLEVGKTIKRFSVQGEGLAKKSVENISIATPICFEDTVPFVVRRLVFENGERKAGVLINLSNDGWFGNHNSGRLQHVREARMRCVENMTPMIRAANTGLSCLIDSRGKVRKIAKNEGEAALMKSAIFHARVFEGADLPLSRFIGDWVAWLSLIGGILLLIGSWKKRSNENENTND
jgi:apolipoprotein N-acyltransferase